ncbi:hypothetical protein evm_013814 [Chilo suppressalis]|nr:hypothetical protein evm_013814 [Chilo suppressalis]
MKVTKVYSSSSSFIKVLELQIIMEKDRDTNVAELTDCNVKVVTLMDLKIRRQELLQETVTYPLNNSINEPLAIPDIAEETINIRINISPDDSIADSNFVPLSDITNVEPMLSNDLNSFPEQNLEADAAKASRKRKRKADRETWKRDLNRKDRMLGKAYTGFKKVNNKYIQNEPKPKRTMGPKCSSSFCARSKILFCSNLTEETRQQIFKRFWNMTWKEKKCNVREEDYQRHIQLKNLARSEKTNDKELAKCGKIHTLTADLQAVKLCPSLSASALYFKTKLAVHNFTVYNLGTNEVTCYWFDETACDLKATTYASFFVDYLRNLLSENLKDVVIWTDGCTAQNRNAVVSNALLRLAMDKNVTITQKYLEKGHTQMEYASLTKEARKKPFPYKVIQPDHTFFKDYSAKEYQVYDSIRPGRSSGDNCVVDLRVLKYNANGTIEFKKHFDEEFRPLPRRPRNISTLISEVPFLYSSRLPILESKYLHLQQLKTVIPSDCHHFYDNLPFHKK